MRQGITMGFNRRKMEDQRRDAAEKDAPCQQSSRTSAFKCVLPMR
jgi:hypothetical protein